MARAGSFKYILEIYRQINQQSASGAMSKVRTKVYEIRANLVRQNGRSVSYPTEETDTIALVFECWYRPEILPTDTLCYRGVEFKIDFIEQYPLERTCRIHCSKINK